MTGEIFLSEGPGNTSLPTPIRFVSYEGREGRRNDDLVPHRSHRVLILYVGGTIGMTRTKDGALQPKKNYLTQVVCAMKELKQRYEIALFDVVEYDVLLDSSDMDRGSYIRIARDIQENYDRYDGFLVLHGTDTMHYTASALSFLLMNLAKPVILTGSMVPLMEPYSDARRNLVIGLMLASNPIICEVCIFFNDRLLRGNCCQKLHHSFGAFCSPNYPVLGLVEATGFALRENLLLRNVAGPLKVQTDMRGRVVAFVLHPNCDVEVMRRLLLLQRQDKEEEEVAVVAEQQQQQREGDGEEREQKQRTVRGATHVDAVLLHISGVCAVNSELAATLRELAQLAETAETLVCVTLREPFGHLSFVEQQRLKAISPHLVYVPMTAAAAEVKLMYLFGKGLSKTAVGEMMLQNLRGEVTAGMLSDSKM